MRVRNRKGATGIIRSESAICGLKSRRCQGGMKFFGNDHPIHIEVGSGKGLITGWAVRPIQRSTTSELILKIGLVMFR